MNKVQLRRRVSNILNNLSKSEKELQSRALLQKVIEHPKYKQAKRISIYLSTENEINTVPILRHALEEANKQCFIPLIAKTKQQVLEHFGGTCRMMMVEVKSMEQYEKLPMNNYGIKEPKICEALEHLNKVSPTSPITDENCLDLILIPGVAFSPDGCRLGHGKGYYDEYLNAWAKLESSNRKLYTLGLAFREQIVAGDKLPMVEGHDFKLDEILYA